MTSLTGSAICGIDIGSENCYIATFRPGGIEILLNEHSQPSTPAYIAFGGNQREFGLTAKQQQLTNISNTIFAPTLLIGKRYEQLNLSEIPCKIEKNQNGEVVIVVKHTNDEFLRLSPTQVLAMLFTKLRQIAGNVVDCVINCPNYFTDTQRRALMDAAEIAGLNPLKIIQDTTAVALNYGFYRTSNPQDYSIVAFIDCGHSSTQASVVLFNNKDNSLNVLETGSFPNIGGKDFDEILADFFIRQKRLLLNNCARYRLIAECEKAKRKMSTTTQEFAISIESLQDDKDFYCRIDRNMFEELSANLFEAIRRMLEKTYEGAEEVFRNRFGDKFPRFKIDAVEMIGGCCQIPAIRRLAEAVFGVEPSTSLDVDEAVAHGCALQCAILSPTFKVARELKIADSLTHEINFRYSFPGQAEKSVNPLFPKGHQYPFTRQISLAPHTLPITIKYDYVNADGLIVPFAEYSVDEPYDCHERLNISPDNPVKLRVSVNSSGIFQATSATHRLPSEKLLNLSIIPRFIRGQLDRDTLLEYQEYEANLILADKKWEEETEAKKDVDMKVYICTFSYCFYVTGQVDDIDRHMKIHAKEMKPGQELSSYIVRRFLSLST